MNVSVGLRRTGLNLAERLGGWPRRAAAVLCLALAAVSALSRTRAASAPARAFVVIASHDLSAGRVLGAGDIQVGAWPVRLVPSAAARTLEQAVGHTLAAAVNAGEPITSARLRGRGLTAGLPRGLVATTVLLSDSAALSILQPGDIIDVIAGSAPDGASSSARVVAHSARVLAVVPGSATIDADAGSLVVAVTQTTALAIAGAAGRAMTATLRGPP